MNRPPGQLPAPRYDYLLGLVDDTGLFEHARYGVPRRRDGYTTDDAARALIVLRGAGSTFEVDRAIGTLLSFVIDSIDPTTRAARNRLGFDRTWKPAGPDGDHHGRLMWALGDLAVSADREEWRTAALNGYEELALPEGPHLRPHAYAALGAAAVWRSGLNHPKAAAVIDRAVARLTGHSGMWPEPRLAYGNGRIPQALIEMGEVLGDAALVERGIDTLDWLHRIETGAGHYSFTPVGGWAPGELRPGFDQQPIEAAAMAGAARAAWAATGDPRWAQAVFDAGSWLLGANDVGKALYFPQSGACCDGLMRGGVNGNRGAESTLSALEVLQACASLPGDLAATVTPLRAPVAS